MRAFFLLREKQVLLTVDFVFARARFQGVLMYSDYVKSIRSYMPLISNI